MTKTVTCDEVQAMAQEGWRFSSDLKLAMISGLLPKNSRITILTDVESRWADIPSDIASVYRDGGFYLQFENPELVFVET